MDKKRQPKDRQQQPKPQTQEKSEANSPQESPYWFNFPPPREDEDDEYSSE